VKTVRSWLFVGNGASESGGVNQAKPLFLFFLPMSFDFDAYCYSYIVSFLSVSSTNQANAQEIPN
jgi:hypothetical protein